MAFDISPFLKELKASQDKANAANEKRYQAALAEMETGRKKIAGQFDTARTDVNMSSARAGAESTQSLMSAGLGNTTITGAAARGIESDRTLAMSRLAGQQGAAEAGYSKDIANLMGQKNETGPDLGLYSGLLAQASSDPPNGFQGTGQIYNRTIVGGGFNGGGTSAFGNGSISGGFNGGGTSAFGNGSISGGNVQGSAGTYSGPKGTATASPTAPAAPAVPAAAAQPAQPGDGNMTINAGKTSFTPYMGFGGKWIYTPQEAAADTQRRFTLNWLADWFGGD